MCRRSLRLPEFLCGLRGEGFGEKARGAQENLWPKFILRGAPLRATSSAVLVASAMPSLTI